MYIPLLSVVIMLLVIFWVFKRRGDLLYKEKDSERRRYLELEHRANFARKKALDDELFFEPDLSKYPVDCEFKAGEEGLKAARKRFVKQAGKKMVVRLDTSNRDLKNAYGAEHLYAIADYEENLTGFFHAGNAFAKSLIENGYTKEAKTLLNALISDNSDMSQTYILLAGILSDSDGETEIDELYEKIDALPQSTKSIIYKSLANEQDTEY